MVVLSEYRDMNKYLIGIRIEGALNAYQKTSFSFREAEIALEFGTMDEGYFNCFVTIQGENNVTALNIAKEIVSEFLDILAFITGCSFAMLEIFLILKDEHDRGKRVVFRQVSTIKTAPVYIRQNEVETINDLLKASEANKKNNLSLHWLRLGYRARTLIEQYSYYWLAFERLMGESQIVRNCNSCGKISGTYPGVDWNNAQSIFFQYEIGLDSDYFKKKILKARHTVFHGGRPDSKFYELLAEISPKIQRVIESILEKMYSPVARIGLETPNQPHRPYNSSAYYAFETKDLGKVFALDYPSDVAIQQFQESGIAKEENENIELLNFDDYMDKW